VALLAAAAAGPVVEDGGVGMRVAPELVGTTPAIVECSHHDAAAPAEISFELLEPGEADDQPRMLAAGSRQGVAFEWHGGTGELTLGGATGAMFNDLQGASTRNAALKIRSCGSR
jgi:hypothetical protein